MAKKEIAVFKETRPYILWRRVSTRQQARSGLGLEAQLIYAQRYMGRDPVVMYTDVCSGKNLKDCTALWQAIEECGERNYALVIAKMDRFRNVEDARRILETVGEGNLIFCDLPECSMFILTILAAIYERQADMIDENTRRGLEMRKLQAEKDGGWFSHTGHWRTHLGNPKGVDTSRATAASAQKKSAEALEWRESSTGYQWVRRQILRGRLQKDILEEFNEMHRDGVKGFCTREGKPLNACTLSKWSQEIRRKNQL